MPLGIPLSDLICIYEGSMHRIAVPSGYYDRSANIFHFSKLNDMANDDVGKFSGNIELER